MFAAVAMTVAVNGLTAHHAWGDDFAGYLLQAQSIAHGTMRSEVQVNADLLAASDGQIGPNAYPWGFPMLIWMVGKLGMTDLVSLKLIGVFSLGATTVFTYLIARIFLGRSLSLIATSLVVLQPDVVGMTDHLMSDVPFLAVSTATLFFMLRVIRAIEIGRTSYGETTAIAGLTVVSFAVRSNGALLAPAFVLASGYVCLVKPELLRTVAATWGVYCAIVLLLLAFYFTMLPDGSLSHAKYLNWHASSVLSRARLTTISTVEFVPYLLIPRQIMHSVVTGMALVASAILFAIGAWANRRTSLILVVYTLLNIVLVLIFPFDQGSRYVYPLLLPAAVLGLSGLHTLSQKLPTTLRTLLPSFTSAAALSFVCTVCLITALAALALHSVNAPRSYESRGPFAERTGALVAFLRANVPREARISFFKPRAMRLLTGRPAIKVSERTHVDRADYFVLNKALEDEQFDAVRTLPISFFEIDTVSRFAKVYDNAQFAVYQRLSGQSRQPNQ